MKDKAFKYCIMIFLLAYAVIAEEEATATSVFAFLGNTVDARSTAMGDVVTGVANDIYGSIGNPAAIAYADKIQAMIAYRPVMLDVRAGAIGFSGPVRNAGTLSGNLNWLSHGIIDGRDINNMRTGVTYRPYSFSGGVSWARMFNEALSMGVTLKGIYENLDHGNSADGAAIDVGAQYRMLSSRLVFGALVRNLGFVRKWYDGDKESDPQLPLALSTGFSYLPLLLPSLRIAIDAEKSVDDYLNYKGGLDIALYKKYLFLRVGGRVSHRDLLELFKIVINEQSNSYHKTHWSLFAIGLGIQAKVGSSDMKIDFALPFHTELLSPTPGLSLLISI